MNVLVIYAHPNPTSLNHSIRETAEETLRETPAVAEVNVLDLYAEGFDPVLVFGQGKRRRDMAIDPRFERHRTLLTEADLLVFVYPVWWGRPPAILLGFFDQVFASGYAYRDQGPGLPDRLLRGKRAVVFSTIKGPGVYSRLWLRDTHRTLMRRAVLGFVGIRTLRFFEFGSMESSTRRREKALERVKAEMRRIRPGSHRRAWPVAEAAVH